MYNVQHSDSKTLKEVKVRGQETLWLDIAKQILFSFAECNMGNMKVGGGAAHPITLMIACKLKTNLFIFGSQDSAAELLGFIPPLGQPKDV